jgi:NADPH:quinone reductase
MPPNRPGTPGVTMHSLQVAGFDPPGQLAVVEVPVPQIGEDQVLIQVEAAGLNFPDHLMASGQYQKLPPLPFTLGMEAAGVVVKAGMRAEQLRVGDRVLVFWSHGAFARYMAVPATRVYRIPDSMGFQDAAVFGLAYATAHFGMVHRARLQAGETVLITGTGGSVGQAAVHLAKSLGATVLAVSRDADVTRSRLGAAADEVLNANPDTLRDAVIAATGGHGPDVVFDVVGGQLLTQAMRAIAWEGRAVVVGFASGHQQPIKPGHLLVKNCAVLGVQVSDYAERRPSLLRKAMNEMLRGFDEGVLPVPTTRSVDLEGLRAALAGETGESGQAKTVLRMNAGTAAARTVAAASSVPGGHPGE